MNDHRSNVTNAPIFPQLLWGLFLASTLGIGTSLCQDAKKSPGPESTNPAENGETTQIKSELDSSDSPYFQNNDPNDPNEYVIQPGDNIQIKVFEETGLDAEQRVDRGGFLNLQLLQRVKIGGLTVVKAKEMLELKYSEGYLIEPSVTVVVIEKALRRFIILGQVRSPGFYEVPRSLKVDILQAIAIAGGYTRIAGTVMIKRTTDDGELKKKFSLRKLRKKPKHEIPMVVEDDTIIVGESLF